MYAINTVALMNAARVHEHMALWLMLRDIVTEQIVQPVRDVPGHDAILVRNDIGEEQWRAIVRIIRTRFKKAQFPLYEKAKGRWKKV